MAFVKRTWKDRISEFPNRRTINDGNVTKQVTVGRDEGNITEEGDSFDASNMNDLEQRIEDAYGDVQGLVASEVAQQYDSANVIFDAEPTEEHGTGYTVTSEGIKTAIDSGLVHTKTVSGSIVHIEDGADNIPVKSLLSQIVAVETGNGQPKSPINPYTISGFSECNLVLSPYYITNFVQGGISDGTGADISSTIRLRSDYIGFDNVVFDMFIHNSQINEIIRSVHFYGATYNYLGYESITASTTHITSIPTGTKYVRIVLMLSTNADITYQGEVAIINGNTYTFTFGQTVYGGHFDNKGNLIVTHGYIASYNGEPINEPWISSMDNYVPNTSPSTGAQVVYPLTTPIRLSITSQDIPTLLGENNIFSNCGDLEVEYYVDTDAIYAIRDVIDEFAMQSDWNEADNTKADYIKNKPTIPANADFSLSGLSDTDISSPSAGQVLVFDGDNWVNSDVEDNYLPNYWSLFADQNTSNTIKTLNVVSGRKISDFSVLFAVVIRESGERVSTIIPVGRFTNGIWVSLTEVDSINTQRWYEVKYVDDEHITVQCSTNATGSEVYIYGLGTAATYS